MDYNNGNVYAGANNQGSPSPRIYAIGSLILGIMSASLVLGWGGGASWLGGIIFGIVGISLANKATKAGYIGGMRTAGMVLSIIGIVLNSLPALFVGCLGCLGCGALCAYAGAAGMM